MEESIWKFGMICLVCKYLTSLSRDLIKQVLNLPLDTVLEYKGHKDSFVDMYNHYSSDKNSHLYEKINVAKHKAIDNSKT